MNARGRQLGRTLTSKSSKKLKHKRGDRKALISVARKMVSYAYWMLKRNQTYAELAPGTVHEDNPRKLSRKGAS